MTLNGVSVMTYVFCSLEYDDYIARCYNNHSRFRQILTIVWPKLNITQSYYRPGQTLRVPRGWVFQISRQSAQEDGKLVSPTHRPPLSPRKCSWYSFLLRLSRPQGHSAAGRIMSMKNSSHTIGNRTRELTACSAVPLTTAPPRAPPKLNIP